MPNFSQKSSDRLKTCSYDLQVILNEVVKHFDITILEGHRGEFKQNQLLKDGKTQVKWPDGKHNSYPSKAVDISPFPVPEKWGALTRNMTLKERDNAWKERLKFYQLASIVKFVADQKGIKVRWGGDWDGDGDYRDNRFEDLVHFEIR